jgi:hypothetical protein
MSSSRYVLLTPVSARIAVRALARQVRQLRRKSILRQEAWQEALKALQSWESEGGALPVRYARLPFLRINTVICAITAALGGSGFGKKAHTQTTRGSGDG